MYAHFNFYPKRSAISIILAFNGFHEVTSIYIPGIIDEFEF